jgi:uncharacterized protein (TIGR02646 family)
MKPVEKGVAPQAYLNYGAAKPDLINRLGAQCSYCERAADPQNLDVEHIYPKAGHPKREVEWENFLISCKSCNSFKNVYLGAGRKRNLLGRFIWPHRENTMNAFRYLQDGRVEVKDTVKGSLRTAAIATSEMVGMLQSPARAEDYKRLGLAYDGVSKREEQWRKAAGFRQMYLENPKPEHAISIAGGAAAMGNFSVWMQVFHDRPEVRAELIHAFKADPACFDNNTSPLPKGRL